MLSDVVHWVTQTLVTPPLCQQSFPGNGGTISSQFNTRKLVHCTTFSYFLAKTIPFGIFCWRGIRKCLQSGREYLGKSWRLSNSNGFVSFVKLYLFADTYNMFWEYLWEYLVHSSWLWNSGGFLTFAKLYLFAQSTWLRAHVKQQCSTLGWLWCDNCYVVIVMITNNEYDDISIIVIMIKVIIIRCQTTMEAQRTLTATLAKSMRLDEGWARWEL